MTEYVERYWRDATPEDAINEPPMVARFRDEDGRWIEKNFRLLGWSRLGTRNNDCLWYSDGVGCYKKCQVYDAPDPGEGWRLVDIESTTRLPSDERWYPSLSKWLSPDDCYCDRYQDGCFYRRRIEQPKPEPRYEPFRWEDREQLRGRWIGSNDGRWERFVAVMYRESDFFWVNGINAESLCADWRFMDTGEPVGRKVE